MQSHHTNSNSPAQSVTRWIAVSLMPEGNVLGVLFDPKDHTITLAWVDDDPSDPNPILFDAENVTHIVDLLANARLALTREGVLDE